MAPKQYISLFNQYTITLPKKITLEVSGFYNSPSIWGGTFLNRAFWGVDAGLQKRFMKEKATIKMSVSDIFHTMQWRGISHFSGLYKLKASVTEVPAAMT